MRIAVNTSFLSGNYQGEYGYFFREMLNRVVKKYYEHEFIFIVDGSVIENFSFPENVRLVVINQRSKKPIFRRFWYDVKIPALLRKNKADMFVSFDGICSLTTEVPQCLFVHDLSFLTHPQFYKKSYTGYYKRNTLKALKKAKVVISSSESLKQVIVSSYKIDGSRIDLICGAAGNAFVPVSDHQKKTTKEKYTDGKEYFLFSGNIHTASNLVNLLKAFSLFKKRMQSNMKLLIASRSISQDKSFIENLKTYKYRNDVIVIEQIAESELANIAASAYALVYPSFSEGFAISVLESFQCATPVIALSGSSIQEIAKEAALYFDANDHKDISEKMMLLYKDENLRKQLIEKGSKINSIYNWSKVTRLFWEYIEKTNQ